MTHTAYDPTAPASEDTRPLALLLGHGAGCHECGRTSTAVVRVGHRKVGTCEHHAEIVERVVRVQLAANKSAGGMRRPRLLDVCCCAGGASMGYYRAGFYVAGVDIDDQPRYPFTFHQADAVEFVREHGHRYDAFHASPPCQLHSDLASLVTADYEDIIAPLRIALIATGKPYVIENVEGSPLDPMVTLCGSMFDLGAGCRDGERRALRRHRLFEANFPIEQPSDRCEGQLIGGVYGDGGGGPMTRGYKYYAAESREAMGIDWMRRRELSESIPPAYTEHVGRALMAHVLASGRLAA